MRLPFPVLYSFAAYSYLPPFAHYIRQLWYSPNQRMSLAFLTFQTLGIGSDI